MTFSQGTHPEVGAREPRLLLSVTVEMMTCGVFGVRVGVKGVRVRKMSVVGGLVVVAGFVMLRGFGVVMGGHAVMMSRLAVFVHSLL